ncbi:bifunctional metallophosphatase/5'-nucleotidase [Bacillus xiapuensis]|uniref:bifunctional metallophosphatase/5'-nucleotidase n=1 Tax=Bacillus xiapuensis TaxID=2014075 RepID=UPI000C250273|nr:bifunctional UDP-sugar hydrolase/5'-nucleotidase [Bacillus xiapuensis]
MRKTIHIYHTNDLHSHFENWPRIRRFLQERKSWHQEAGEEVFLFDLGDHVDRSHPLTEGTLGQANVELLNQAQVNAGTIGNNEGITLPKEALDRLYQRADFPVVVANLYDSDGGRPSWARPSYLFEMANGMKLGVTGVTAFFQASYEELGWKLSHPHDELKQQVVQLKQQADMIIVLSHLGIHDDEKIAADHADVDVVLGAHTHHLLHEGKDIHGTLLAAAGKFGYYVGHVELEIDLETKSIVSKKASVYRTSEELEAPPGEKEQIEQFYEQGKKSLQQPVVQLPSPLSCCWFEPSELPSILCEALTEWCEADCGFLNAGVVLDGLEAGMVTRYDLHRILPHPINPCAVELTGAELKEVMKQTFNEEWPHLTVKGLGFRGKVMGQFVFDRMEADMKRYLFRVNGRDIVAGRTYRLATLDMFTYGYFFPQLQRAASKKYFMPEFLRDVLEWKLLQLNSQSK